MMDVFQKLKPLKKVSVLCQDTFESASIIQLAYNTPFKDDEDLAEGTFADPKLVLV